MSTPTNPTPAPAPNPIEALAAAIVQALKQSNSTLADALQQNNTQLVDAINAAKPKARITIANRKSFNPMNPTGEKRKLSKDYYQNFYKMDVEDMTPAEYELLPKLREGNYIKDDREGYLIEVIEVKRGAQRGVHIRYNNKTVDQRVQMMVRAGASLEEWLRKCIAEHEANKVEARRKRREEDED